MTRWGEPLERYVQRPRGSSLPPLADATDPGEGPARRSRRRPPESSLLFSVATTIQNQLEARGVFRGRRLSEHAPKVGEKGASARIPIRWNDATKTLTIGKREGAFPGMQKAHTFEVVLVSKDKPVGFSFTPKADKTARYEGASVDVKL